MVYFFDARGCPSCGERRDVRLVGGDVHRCERCGASFRRSSSGGPEHAVGDLLVGTDLGDRRLVGWSVSKPEVVRFDSVEHELVARVPGSPNSAEILRSSGYFADLDVGVTFRFIDADVTDKWSGIGLSLRWRNDGRGTCDYLFEVRASGRYAVFRFREGKSESLVPLIEHAALRVGVGERNRLRVVADGPSLRVFLNGVLASSVRDEVWTQGRIRLVVTPPDASTVEVGFAELEIREPRARWL